MNADHSIACGVFTNDDGRCTCKEAPDEKSPWLLDGELDVAHHYATRNRPLIENMDPRSESAAQDRCQAVLKSVYRWRCTRRAGRSGLCAQHRYFGARVPERWEHPVLPNGVVSCEPVSPIRHVPGVRDAA